MNTVLENLTKNGIHKEAKFSASIHPNLVGRREIIRKAREAGCTSINIGIESGNNDILRKLHRKYTIEEAHQAVNILNEEGMKTHGYYIIGHPGETHKTVLDTIRAVSRINTTEIGIGVMVPYPGTEIYEMAKKNTNGYRLTHTDWDAYDKYGGSALHFEWLKKWHIKLYQVLGYLLFYLRKMRIRDMLRYLAPRMRAGIQALKN